VVDIGPDKEGEGRSSLSCRVVEPEEHKGWTVTDSLVCHSGCCGRCYSCGEGLLPSERYEADLSREVSDSPLLLEALEKLEDREDCVGQLEARIEALKNALRVSNMARAALEPPQDKDKDKELARCFGAGLLSVYASVYGDDGQTLVGRAVSREYLPGLPRVTIREARRGTPPPPLSPVSSTGLLIATRTTPCTMQVTLREQPPSAAATR